MEGPVCTIQLKKLSRGADNQMFINQTKQLVSVLDSHESQIQATCVATSGRNHPTLPLQNLWKKAAAFDGEKHFFEHHENPIMYLCIIRI